VGVEETVFVREGEGGGLETEVFGEEGKVGFPVHLITQNEEIKSQLPVPSLPRYEREKKEKKKREKSVYLH